MSPSIINRIKSLWQTKPEFHNPRNILLTGVPRSGTTLTCFLLTEIPNSVGLNEPVRIGRLGSRENIIAGIEKFFNRNRHTLLYEGVALARATEKGITDNNFSKDQGDRKTLVQKQKVKIDKELQPDFYLTVKHNSSFTILMDELRKRYPFYAQIRNPIPVLGSWNSLDIPVSRGEIRASEWMYPEFHQKLQSIPDLYERQLFILDWYYRSYIKLPEDHIIRYEELIRTNGRELQKIVPEAANLDYPLDSKNKSKLYDSDVMQQIGALLLSKEDHACWHFYTKEEVRKYL
jgi:hypothetical protein